MGPWVNMVLPMTGHQGACSQLTLAGKEIWLGSGGWEQGPGLDWGVESGNEARV